MRATSVLRVTKGRPCGASASGKKKRERAARQPELGLRSAQHARSLTAPRRQQTAKTGVDTVHRIRCRLMTSGKNPEPGTKRAGSECVFLRRSWGQTNDETKLTISRGVEGWVLGGGGGYKLPLFGRGVKTWEPEKHLGASV